MKPQTAAKVTRSWTLIYTMWLPREQREMRRAELESDLWESLADDEASKQILSRLIFGTIDDMTWSIGQMERTAREAFWWSVGSLLTVTVIALWLAYTPDAAPMLTWSWAWPIAEIFHVLGLVSFIVLRTAIDLRLATRAFGTIPISRLVRKLTPISVLAVAVTILSGMALYMADSTRFAVNPVFQIKLAVLAIALINVWYMHAVTFRKLSDWDTAQVPPLAARIGARLSLSLWATIIVFAMLTPYIF